ncbi:MAG: hypothetical protein FJY17_05785 [Bacteroidetes bacterium]|nr:hypothetical protein [Bacteroidota bacterium]
MASRRDLKKKINQFILANVIDECIYLEEQNPELVQQCDKIIDEAVEFYNVMMTKINHAKSKADFREIHEKFEASANKFVDALNQINA